MDTLRTLLLSLLFAAAGTGVLAAASSGFRVFTSESARRLAVREQPTALPALALESDAGRRIALADFNGRWLLVDFIYTRCLTWCSILGGDFARLQRELAPALSAGELQLLSISFDPEHDDPTALSAWKRRFGDGGSGWTAARPLDQAELATALASFGIKVIPDGIGGFEHNASVALVDPQGRLVDIFDAGQPQAVAAAMKARLAR